jgi:Zn ribbon nucleic-acid-binding protein
MIVQINILIGVWCRVEMKYSQNNTLKNISDLWKINKKGFKCPNCKADLIIVQADAIQDWNNPYQSYDTIVECVYCSFQAQAVSYTILGSLNKYDINKITIEGWSPSGSRVETTLEHLLDYQLLKELKSSQDLVEFLIIDEHAIQVIH